MIITKMRLKCVFPLAVFAALLLGQAACQMDTFVDDSDFDYMMDGSAGSGGSAELRIPDQLTGFEFSVEEDDRLEFFDHHVIHLQWEQPERIELVESYTIELEAVFDLGSGGISGIELCGTRTISGVPADATVRARTVGEVPLSACFYRTRIIVNPLRGFDSNDAVTVFILTPQYQQLSPNNIDFTCSAQLNRNTALYDIQFNWNIPYPDPLLFAIAFIEVTSLEITEAGGINPSGVDLNFVRVFVPNTANISQMFGQLVADVAPLTRPGNFYRFISRIAFEYNLPRQLDSITQACEVTNVGPAPPDQVPNESITVVSEFAERLDNQTRTAVGDFAFSWVPPEFQGFGGIVRYDVYIGREILGPNALPPLEAFELEGNRTSGAHTYIKQTDEREFIVNLQIRARSIFAAGEWSEPFPIIVSFTRPRPPRLENITAEGQLLSVSSTVNGIVSVSISFEITWSPPSEFPVSEIERYTAFLGEDFVEEPFGSIPSSAQSATYEPGTSTGSISGVFAVAAGKHFIFYIQIRTESITGLNGEWSLPIRVTVNHPPIPTVGIAKKVINHKTLKVTCTIVLKTSVDADTITVIPALTGPSGPIALPTPILSPFAFRARGIAVKRVYYPLSLLVE